MELTKTRITLLSIGDAIDNAVVKAIEALGYEVELVSQVPDNYVASKELLADQVMMASVMGEIYQENQFLIGQWNYLAACKSQLIADLVKTPMDIRMTVELKKVEHDLEILIPASSLVNKTIFKHLQEKFGRGLVFQYCKTE